MNNVRSKVGLARQGKLKRHDGSEVNAMAVKTSVKVSLPSLHDKPYQSLGLCVLQAILEDSIFAIAIINVTFNYSATLASARRTVFIICGILALYSENAAETKVSWGHSPRSPCACATRAFMLACKRVRLKREASGLHNLWNSCSIL